MTRAPADPSKGEHAQAVACLVPAATLFSGVLHGVPTHTSAAAGWVLLASLPALTLAILRQQPFALRGLPALLVVIAVALFHTLGRTDLDNFEASRALMSLSSWLVLLLCAASLAPAGRRTLARGLICLTALGLGFAWIDTLREPLRAFSGALENSGDLSETALPGALLGYACLRSETRAWRIAGLLTTAAYLITVGRAPVLAGALSFLVAASVGSVLGRARGKTLSITGLLMAALAFGGTYLATHRDGGERPAPDQEQGSASDIPSTLGGVAFRRMTWARVPGMVADHPLIGAGPGQFARTFPTYRDPREIELSSHSRRAPTSTEVEHAHNDWLEGFAEYGLLGGGAWLIFGALAAARALAILGNRRGVTADPIEGAYALAGIGVILNAGFNSPLLEGPAFATVAPLLGVLLATRQLEGKRRPGSTALIIASAAMVLAQAPQASRFVRHGAALAPLTGAATTVVAGQRMHTVEGKSLALEQALAACPDSTIALGEMADLKRSTGAPPEQQLELWQAVIERRPHHLEALMAIANLHARAERFDQAREYYARAAQVDPNNPQLGENTLLLALRTGDVEAVLTGLVRQGERGTLDPVWLERSAAELLLSGRPHLGLPILKRAHPEWQVTSAESAYGLSKSLSENPDQRLIADALLAHAHFSWAREHASSGDAASAVRSYRQCLIVADSYPNLHGGAARVRLELSAAESLRGTAQTGAPRPELSEVDRRELPDWALEELRRLDWPGADRP